MFSAPLPQLTPRTLPEMGYVAPRTLGDAISILGEYGTNARVLAGGSDLMHRLKRDLIQPPPEVLVDIKGIPELQGSDVLPDGGLRMGALLTLRWVETSTLIQERYPLLGQAVGLIGAPQIRNVATVGGALSQQVWCWFLRNGLKCWRAGGEMCYAVQPGADNRYYHSVVMGGKNCHAVHPSDLAVALDALDAQVTVAGPYGTKSASLHDFLPGSVWSQGIFQSHILAPNELLTNVTLPAPPPTGRSIYLKTRIRNAFDFAIASIAMVLPLEGGIIRDPRVVFGGVAPFPYRDQEVEADLNGEALSSLAPDALAGVALSQAVPLENNGYKVDVAKGLLRAALTQISGQD